MTIRTRAELDEALLRIFVEALADEPDEVDETAPSAPPDAAADEERRAEEPSERRLVAAG